MIDVSLHTEEVSTPSCCTGDFRFAPDSFHVSAAAGLPQLQVAQYDSRFVLRMLLPSSLPAYSEFRAMVSENAGRPHLYLSSLQTIPYSFGLRKRGVNLVLQFD